MVDKLMEMVEADPVNNIPLPVPELPDRPPLSITNQLNSPTQSLTFPAHICGDVKFPAMGGMMVTFQIPHRFRHYALSLVDNVGRSLLVQVTPYEPIIDADAMRAMEEAGTSAPSSLPGGTQ